MLICADGDRTLAPDGAVAETLGWVGGYGNGNDLGQNWVGGGYGNGYYGFPMGPKIGWGGGTVTVTIGPTGGGTVTVTIGWTGGGTVTVTVTIGPTGGGTVTVTIGWTGGGTVTVTDVILKMSGVR